MIPEQATQIGTAVTQFLARTFCAGLLALGVCAVTGQAASAQSAYACRALETHRALPSVEGADGMFFRILPDLQAGLAMGDPTIDAVGALSGALAARGTTLVLMPVPGRAQVMGHKLPVMARHLGYDPDIATAVYIDMIKRLRAAGVTVADARGPLRKAALGGTPVFFDTDPRPTPQGAQVMAQVVADALADVPALKDLPRATFQTTQGEPFTLASSMHARLQLACQDKLPDVSAPSFVTAGNVIAASPGVAAVLGTQITGTPELNLAGFSSEATGIRAGAVAAAGQTCTQPVPLVPGDATNKVLADLTSIKPGSRVTLALDTGGAAVPQVRFHFTSADGLTRSRGIFRHHDQILTRAFQNAIAVRHTCADPACRTSASSTDHA